jgi:hypothetical protein
VAYPRAEDSDESYGRSALNQEERDRGALWLVLFHPVADNPKIGERLNQVSMND